MKENIFILVKTEPVLSKKYFELVCTAGINAQGEWRRLYPIPFRMLEKDLQYRKYQWIEIDILRNRKDPRIESYRPLDENIHVGDVVSTGERRDWQRRKDILSRVPVYEDLDEIIAAAKDNKLSLCVFKPAKITGFVIKKSSPNWDKSRLREFQLHKQQSELFSAFQKVTQEIEKLPFDFSYCFEDIRGKEATLMITDWEIGQLYRNCVKRHNGNVERVLADVRKKYDDQFLRQKDLLFFLGTTQRFHFFAPNPFIIVGIFYPPKQLQESLL